MSKFKVVKNFDRVSDATLLTITEGIIRALTGNSYYASPLPSLIELTNQKIKFENALAAAANGGKTLTAAKNEAIKIAPKVRLASALNQSLSNGRKVSASLRNNAIPIRVRVGRTRSSGTKNESASNPATATK